MTDDELIARMNAMRDLAATFRTLYAPGDVMDKAWDAVDRAVTALGLGDVLTAMTEIETAMTLLIE